MSKNRQTERKTARIRHKHDEPRIPGLREKMIEEGIDSLQVEKVFKDLGQLKDFDFLTDLSIRGLKKGIATVGNLTKLEDLALWDIRDLVTDWMEELQRLTTFTCYGVKFKTFSLPAPPNALRFLKLTNCNGFGGVLDTSRLENTEELHIDACGHISRIADCSRLTKLTNVFISNIRDLESLEEIARAPNLRFITVQRTPNLKVSDLQWMLEHPTLEKVYPALIPVKGDPILEEIQELLGPRFGDDLF